MKIIGASLALIIWWLGLWLNTGEPYVGIYHAQNTGIFIGAQTTCRDIGLEIIGHPGFFKDEC